MLSSEKCGLNGIDLDATLEKSETKIDRVNMLSPKNAD